MPRSFPPGVAATLCAAIGCAALAAGCATVDEKTEGPIIDSLHIEGTKKVSERELKGKLLTAESGWIPLVSEEHRFDPNTWQADLRRIERHYQAKGYYQAKVVDAEVLSRKDDHVDITVKVSEGEPTLLATLEVTGIDGLPDKQRKGAFEALDLKTGALFLEERWASAKEALQHFLREEGYAEALVSGSAQVDLELRKADAKLEVELGQRYRFGETFVDSEPDAKVPKQFVAEQVQSAVEPGQWYSESALAEAQARAFQMGVFGAAKVNRTAVDREKGEVPVVVTVKEAPFRTLRFGGGLGVDPARFEARALGEYSNRNFFGGLRKATLGARAGYAYLRDTGKFGPVAKVNGELEQPRLLGQRSLTGQLGVDLKRGLEPAFSFFEVAPRIGVRWQPTSTLSLSVSYNLDAYLLSEEAGLTFDATASSPLGCSTTCTLSYLEQRLELDRRDDRGEPKQGLYAALALQEGGGPLRGSFTYLRVVPEVRGYYSVGARRQLTFAAKLKLGTLLSPGESPIVARFFSGGSSMRGFNSRRLSPLQVKTRTTSSGEVVETVPIGGDGLLESSFEVRYDLIGDFVVAAFVDAGLVSCQSLVTLPGRTAVDTPCGKEQAITPPLQLVQDNLYVGVGVGLRYRTPIGPIRLDLAYRPPIGPELLPNPGGGETAYPTYGSCFGFGSVPQGYSGAPEGLCSLHISIAEAF